MVSAVLNGVIGSYTLYKVVILLEFDVVVVRDKRALAAAQDRRVAERCFAERFFGASRRQARARLPSQCWVSQGSPKSQEKVNMGSLKRQ
jgi:hypothetical protein